MIMHDGNGKGDDLREKDQLDRVVVFCLISFSSNKRNGSVYFILENGVRGKSRSCST
jgi:hypothetical protein